MSEILTLYLAQNILPVLDRNGVFIQKLQQAFSLLRRHAAQKKALLLPGAGLLLEQAQLKPVRLRFSLIAQGGRLLQAAKIREPADPFKTREYHRGSPLSVRKSTVYSILYPV